MRRNFYCTMLVLFASTAAFADIPRPDKSPNPKPGISSTLEIKLDANTKEAILIIPKSQINQLRAELEALDDDSGNTAAVTGGISRIQTIVSGAFLSLAFVFGGMWFVRSGRSATKTGKALIAMAVIAGIGSAVTLVFANAGPPPEARSITSRLFDKNLFFPYRFASGKIKIETSDKNYVQLIVPEVSATPSAKE